jgi:ubiquitin carboxyl-terminal hydrolase 4/11/15
LPSRKRSQSTEMGGAPVIEQDVDMIDNSGYNAVKALQVAQTKSKPSSSEQLQQIDALKDSPLQVGDTWYLIDKQWERQWRAACAPVSEKDSKDGEGSSTLTPDDLPPIDNSRMLQDDGSLKELPIQGQNVEFLPKQAWLLLEQW